MAKLYQMETDDPAAGYAARVDAVAGEHWRGPDAAMAYNDRIGDEAAIKDAMTWLFMRGVLLGFALGAILAMAVTWLR